MKELSDCSPVVKDITAKVYGDKRFFFPHQINKTLLLPSSIATH